MTALVQALPALICDHCGGDAIESNAAGLFHEDMGSGACASCGFPGGVRVEEDGAYWLTRDDADSVCDDFTCAECEEYR